MRIILSSQFRDSSGYATAARGYLKAIDQVLPDDVDFKILSIAVEKQSKISIKEEKLIQKYEIDLNSLQEYIKEDYIMVWHQPTGMLMFGDRALSQDPKWIAFRFLLRYATKNINMTVWESNKIPDIWTTLHKANKTTSCVVPCSWNKQTFEKTGIKTYCLPHVIEDDIVQPREINGFPINLDDKFVVFSMSQWIKRKGFDSLIAAYCMEFNNNDDAVMVIKTYIDAMNTHINTFGSQAQHIATEIRKIKSGVIKDGKPSNAKIVPICNILPYNNISWLYSKADVFALATRGEGFGLTISESIMHEKPVIVPNFGGHIDYLDKDTNFLFKGHEHPYMNDPTYDYDMDWYEPDIKDLRIKLRQAYELWKENKNSLSEMGKKAKSFVKKNGYDYKTIGNQFIDIVREHWEDKNLFSYSSAKKKLELLKDKYKGQECYILTCGPSLKSYNPNFLKEKLKDKLVIAVKQAYNYCPEVVDFHLFNSNNFECYQYKDPRPYVITTSAESELAMIHSIWSNKQENDLFCFIPDDRDKSKQVARSLAFDDYLFDKTPDRPWGPGMMTEIVIYLAVHLGVKEINTIGWDLEKPGTTKSNHFYKNRQVIRPADSMPKEEIELNIEMSKHLYKWLKEKGIDLYVANEDSHLHNIIPRRLINE